MLPLQYVDYALWQREALAPCSRRTASYWRSMLREGALPVLELPLDYARPAVQTFAGDVVPVHDRRRRGVAPGVGARRVVGCTLFQVVLACGAWCCAVTRVRRRWWWARRTTVATRLGRSR